MRTNGGDKADMIFAARMSAIGPKQTRALALHMSAFGGKADMTVCGCLLSRSLLGAKRTSLFALHMSAFDPKRTFGALTGRTLFQVVIVARYDDRS